MPPLAWEAIETRLDERAAGKKRRVAAWVTVAAAALVLGGGYAAWLSLGSSTTSSTGATVAEVLHPEQAPRIEPKNYAKVSPEASVESVQSASKLSVVVKNHTVVKNEVNSNDQQLAANSQENLVNGPVESFVLFQDFNSAGLTKRPFTFEVLQSSINIHPSQKPTNRQLSRWAFEVGYDQNQTAVTYRTATGMEQYVHKNYLNHMKQSEVALSASQAHLAVRYQLSPNWIISAGLGWMQNRTQQNFQFRDSMPFSVSQGYTADAYGNYPIFGYLSPGPQVNYSGISNVSMLSLPLGMIWEKAISKRLTLTAEALMQANYLSLRKGSTLNYHYLTLQDIGGDTYRNLLWSAKFGAGLQRELSRRNAFGARVNAQGMITPLFKSNSAVENRGWSVGLSAYYVWRFN